MPYTPETINSGDPITAEWGNKIEQELAKLDKKPSILAANEDVVTTTSSAWTGLKGFTLLNSPSSPMGTLGASVVANVSPSSASGNLRINIYDYYGDNSLLVSDVTNVTASAPTLVEIGIVDVSTLTPGAYLVSLQGNVSGGSLTIIATEFRGG